MQQNKISGKITEEKLIEDWYVHRSNTQSGKTDPNFELSTTFRTLNNTAKIFF